MSDWVLHSNCLQYLLLMFGLVQRLLRLTDNDILGIVDSKLDAQLLTDALNDLRQRDVSLTFWCRSMANFTHQAFYLDA